jgi:hypothetical protein
VVGMEMGMGRSRGLRRLRRNNRFGKSDLNHNNSG